MARNSFSSVDCFWVGCSERCHPPRSCVEPDQSHTLCQRGRAHRPAVQPGEVRPLGNRPSGRLSAETPADVPNGRSRHGSWSSGRRASSQWPGFVPPFATTGAAMRLGMCAVEQHLGWWSTAGCQGVKDLQPNTLRRPANKPIIQRLARSIAGRCIRPPTSRFQHMNDPADHPTIVDSWHPAWLVRQQRRQTRPLLILQPKFVRHPLTPTVWECESDS